MLACSELSAVRPRRQPIGGPIALLFLRASQFNPKTQKSCWVHVIGNYLPTV
jgi:hypothetical protein